MKARLPAYGQERLAALRRYEDFDSMSDQACDDITLLASAVGLVSLVDEHRQRFKSKIGFATPDHAILNPSEVLVVPSATIDKRFSDTELILKDPSIRVQEPY